MKKLLISLLFFIPLSSHAKLTWELISQGEPNALKDAIYRARVPHGWLIVYSQKKFNLSNDIIDFGSITFYPDEQHEWKL